MSKKVKEYTNGEITVIWDSSKCFHAANCVKLLPEVYKPGERPWIQVDNGSTEAIKAQIKNCPSGALTFFMNQNPAERTGYDQPLIEAIPNGPLVIYGDLKVESEGKLIEKNSKTAFCRCGGSSSKPFCDGSHMKNNFKDE